MEAGLSLREQARCASLQLAHCSAMLPSWTAAHQASVPHPNLSAGTHLNHSNFQDICETFTNLSKTCHSSLLSMTINLGYIFKKILNNS